MPGIGIAAQGHHGKADGKQEHQRNANHRIAYRLAVRYGNAHFRQQLMVLLQLAVTGMFDDMHIMLQPVIETEMQTVIDARITRD